MAAAVRGLLVTPWFAAATGFVVAAGMWIYSPHAELKFPPSAVGVVPCEAHGCGVDAGQDGGALATTTRQHIGKSGKSTGKAAAQTDGGGGTAVSRLAFGYAVLWQRDGKFGVLITVTGKHIPGAWKLTFAMPGDQISDVMGAAWHPAGADGGTASELSGPAPGQWQGQLGSGDHSDPGVVSRHRRGFSFLVLGQGTPVVPTGCSFNGTSCAFS
jgi:hypothetical protein